MNNRNRAYIAFISPSIFIIIILSVIPVILLVTFSTTSWELIRQGSFKFIGLENFRHIFRDSRAINSIKVSFYYIIVNTIIQMFFGFVLAYLLYRVKKGTQLFRSVLLIPSLVPPVVVGISWRILFTPDLGGINYFLSLLSLKAPDWLSFSTTALIAVTVASVWEWTPLVMLVLLAGLESLPTDPIEAAIVDGANQLQLIWMLIIPLMKPIILVIIILRIIDALGILPIIYMMTSGGPGQATESINVYAYDVGFKFLNIGYASSLLVLFVFIIFIFSFLFILLTMKGKQ